MLYQNEDAYTPSLKINEENFLLLDLSVTNRQFCLDIFERIGKAANSARDKIIGQFIDAIISPLDLNFKVKAIVLTSQCFWRKYQPLEENESLSQTVYQFLKRKYQNMLTIGLKIDLLNLSQFQKMKDEGILKKIKLFSFDIHQSLLQKQLPILRQIIKQHFSVKSKRMFHINIDLIDAKGLKILKKQMIDHEYPMQYCTIQSNLLNIIEDTFSKDIEQDWQQLAFKYCQVINKYVPSAIGSFLEGYKIKQDKEINLSSLYSCINHINRRNQNQQKQYKKHHHTGIGTIQQIIQIIALDFTPTLYGHIRVKSDFDLYLGKLYDAVTGNYKSQQRQYQMEDVQI